MATPKTRLFKENTSSVKKQMATLSYFEVEVIGLTRKAGILLFTVDYS